MKTSWMKALAFVAVALLVVPAAFGQTTGRIDGRVLDTDGGALPGVTVQITSEALQGERISVTDADGRFRFLAVPVGNYDLRATLEGYGIVEQPNVDVGLDRVVSLQLTMDQAFGDEVTVSGIAPIIDTTSTTSGANFNEQLFQDLPTSRTFTGLAFAAPGVVGGGLGANPSIGGASAAENRYVIDGLDTTNAAFGTIGTTVPQEFVREVEVKTGGYEAEYGGALGGFVNVITKSGGNELEGDIFGYYTDDSLQEDEDAVLPSAGRDLGFEEYDFGAALGGKLIQDKLWYFVAANPTYEDRFIETTGGLRDTNELDRLFYSAKLTWQLNPNHQIVASGFGDPAEDNFTSKANYGRIGNNDEFGADNYGLTYNGTLGANLFLEASVGRYEEDEVSEPYDGFNGGPRYRILTGAGFVRDLVEANFPCGNLDPYYTGSVLYNTALGCEGATFRVDDNRNARDEARGSLTWFGNTGAIDHEVKFGGTVRDVEYIDSASYPGRNLSPFVDSDGTLVDPGGLRGQRIELRGDHVRFIDYDQDSEGNTDESALYLQDTVRFSDYFTLNLGVRADQYESTGTGSGDTAASGGLPRQLEFDYDDMVAPRIGFTWDAFQNGRSKVYGHWGQFYESVPLDINVRAFGDEIFQFYLLEYPTDANGNVVLPTFENPGDLFFSLELGTGSGVDPNLEPMYTEEALAGIEYEVIPNVAVGAKYVTREIKNVIEDISVNGGSTYFITNPGQEFCSDPVFGGPVFDDITHEEIDCVQFPSAVREYEALEFTLNKRFSNNWQLYSSLVWSENYGNYGGLFRQDNGQLDPNITSLFDLPSLLNGATGLLPNDREWQFKLYGSYVWPMGLTTGFYAQYLDGTPISQLGAHDVYGQNERFVTPRGSFGRTPEVYNVDVHLQYPISLGSGNDLKLIVDVFNITDEQEVTVVDQTWTTAAGTATAQNNPDFGEALVRQSPRTIRLGAKFSF